MKKNTVLVINPLSINLMKAIYNALATNLLDIIIVGDRKVIYEICEKLNYNIQLLQIVDCTDKENLYRIINQYKDIKDLQGIIIDDVINGDMINIIHSKMICKIIDFGIFKKSIFIINNTNINNIKDTINIINDLNIYNVNIAVVQSDKEQTNKIKQEIKKEVITTKINVISKSKIKKNKYNIIIFDDKFQEILYLKEIKNQILTREMDVKKASKVYIFDAKGKSLKNIFIQFLFLSKIDPLLNEINTQIG